MCQYALYLDLAQFRALRARICRFLRRHPEYRRRRSRAGLTISEMLRLTLAAFRHNLRQRLLAWVFKVHQSTVCRVVAWMRGVLAEVLADLVPGGGDIAAAVSGLLSSTGRPIIALVDGTLVPVSQRRSNRDDYSGKHRRPGRNVQVVCGAVGNLLHVAAPLPGRYHDRRAVAESGIEAALKSDPRLLAHADKGYIGTGFIVPRRPSKHHPLTIAQRVENREINVIRCPVERSIAGIKVLDILRSGIRTRSPRRGAVIDQIIAVGVGLVFFRQRWSRA